jgi:hypothetical protein
MREFNTGWLASEHTRLHNIELWPDSPRKRIALSAVHSSLDSLSRQSRTGQGKFICLLCQSKNANLKVMEAPRGMAHADDFYRPLALSR